MELRWGHLCSTADFDNGSWTLHDLAEGYSVGQDGTVDFHEEAHLALLFHAHANEPQVQRFGISLTDGSGKSHADPRGDDVHFVNIGDGLPRVGPKRITLTNWRIPGTAGNLTFTVFDKKGGRLGRIPLNVYAPGTFAPTVAPVPTGKKVPKRPFRLVWAHIAEGFEVDPMTHTLTLRHIFDFSRIPPSIDGVILGPACLALQIAGDPAAGPDHTLTIRVVDPDGRPVDWELQRQVRFMRPRPGATPLCSEVFDLTDRFLMGEGGFEFQAHLGDKYAGGITLQVHKG